MIPFAPAATGASPTNVDQLDTARQTILRLLHRAAGVQRAEATVGPLGKVTLSASEAFDLNSAHSAFVSKEVSSIPSSSGDLTTTAQTSLLRQDRRQVVAAVRSLFPKGSRSRSRPRLSAAYTLYLITPTDDETILGG